MKRFIVLLLPILLLTGCSKQISVNSYADIDSIPYGFIQGSSFYVSTKSENGTLLDKEVAKKISNVLKDKGYRIADKQSAQYCLLFDYDMESEKREVQTFEQVGKTVVAASGNTYGHGHSHCYDRGCHTCYNDSAHYDDQIVATQMGYVSRDVMFFTKNMVIEIYDAKEYGASKKNEEIWRCEVLNDDQDADLRSSLDFLIVTALEYLGKSTQKRVCVSIKDGNKNVKKLRKSYSQAFEYKEL